MQQDPSLPEEPRPDTPQPSQPGQPTPVPPETPTRTPNIDVPSPKHATADGARFAGGVKLA